MYISFFEIQNWEKPYLKKILKGHKVQFFAEPLSLLNADKTRRAEIIGIFIGSKIDKKILYRLPKLKAITTMSTGFDHIDLEAAKTKRIIVCNVPTYGENTVAEHTFALILALSRNIHKSYVRTRKDNFSAEGLKGFDLKGKTLGVVGAGHIGLHVIKMAKGFGMNVLVFDARQNHFLEEVLDFSYVPFGTLLKKSDIITLHVPYNEQTHHLINTTAFRKIKKGAILINTSRGGVVETSALLKALEDKRLTGAGLDVIEGEEFIKEEKQILHDKARHKTLRKLITKDHLILDKDNVVYTPHIAFYSQEALQRILETTAKNILDFIKGKPRNVVH